MNERESELFDKEGTYMKTFNGLGIDAVLMTKIDEIAAKKEGRLCSRTQKRLNSIELYG